MSSVSGDLHPVCYSELRPHVSCPALRFSGEIVDVQVLLALSRSVEEQQRADPRRPGHLPGVPGAGEERDPGPRHGAHHRGAHQQDGTREEEGEGGEDRREER